MTTAAEVKLLTLLNVTAVKRPHTIDAPGGHRGSPQLKAVAELGGLNGSPKGHAGVKRRKSVTFAGVVGPSGTQSGKAKKGRLDEVVQTNGHTQGISELEADGDGSGDEAGSDSVDIFNVHFGSEPPLLQLVKDQGDTEWTATRTTLSGYGKATLLEATADEARPQASSSRIVPSLLSSVKAGKQPVLLSSALAQVGSYRDLYLHSLDSEAEGREIELYGPEKEAMRRAIAVHSINHILKTRRRIIRNNEKLARSLASDTPIDVPRDQSFTRPKILLLLPFRSLALHYLKGHLLPLAPTGTQIENLTPFASSFSIDPSGDPLAGTSSFPIDHRVNFQGNSDDNFRFGIKLTRKAWRVVMMPANEAKLMECDILVASPLAMKMQAEREDSSDLLSSIEVVVVDGVDALLMQNWEHVQFVFEHLNQIPKSPHRCDFSRVKPWYLDQKSRFLRQSLILSRYDTPEARSLFSQHCQNLEGKIRLDRDFTGVLDRVRSGVRQVFERFDEGQRGFEGSAAAEEVEARLSYFTKKTIPDLLRSAVTRQNTLIVVPSYFDFVRLTTYLRKSEALSFAAISEYSSNPEISRARTLFFKSRKPFLIITERFHFYRRYAIRGAKTIVFYQLPEHAQFYSEFLDTPFITSHSSAEVDPEDVSCRVLYSRFDAMRLQRVVGSRDAKRLMSGGRFEFA